MAGMDENVDVVPDLKFLIGRGNDAESRGTVEVYLIVDSVTEKQTGPRSLASKGPPPRPRLRLIRLRWR